MTVESTVLLVDDHKDNLFALESALAPLRLPLERADTGDAALRATLRGNVSLIVLDVLMPDLGGLEVARYLSRLEQTRAIPVVLVTGANTSTALIGQALELGVADFLTKPIDPLALCIKVQYLYRMRQSAQRVPAQPTARTVRWAPQ
ncbi:two-component system response regulator [Streptomyces sp. NPDC053474]|uniref:two-component system response regulator n=1 Tax=Streptomyces sp. NPDC053474 TaxID=3365704 RepID=UPI0037CED5C8